MIEDKGLKVRTPGEIRENLPELSIRDIVDMRTIQMETIKEIMKKNVHYGRIPGTPKPSLWQPGAQVLDVLHGYAPSFELLNMIEDWDGGFFMYRYMCRLIRKRDGVMVGEGIGSCNSKEKKYREAVYHGDDEGKPVDPRDNVNTFEKMAQKRAHIFATLNATGLSDIFTQDVEDMVDQFIPGEYRVIDDDKPEAPKAHWCPIHNVPFFKKGRMKWWAHKIEGTDEWCSESAVMKQAKEAPPQKGDEKARRDTFLKLCKQHGWDHETTSGVGAISAWVMENFGAKWLELTAEAQVEVIVRMRNIVEGTTPEGQEDPEVIDHDLPY